MPHIVRSTQVSIDRMLVRGYFAISFNGKEICIYNVALVSHLFHFFLRKENNDAKNFGDENLIGKIYSKLGWELSA